MSISDDVMREGIQAVLSGAAMMLEQIPTDDLERYVADIDAQVQKFEQVGWVVDPTAYRKAMSGDREYESIKLQLEVARHLLQARRELQKLRTLAGRAE